MAKAKKRTNWKLSHDFVVGENKVLSAEISKLREYKENAEKVASALQDVIGELRLDLEGTQGELKKLREDVCNERVKFFDAGQRLKFAEQERDSIRKSEKLLAARLVELCNDVKTYKGIATKFKDTIEGMSILLGNRAKQEMIDALELEETK